MDTSAEIEMEADESSSRIIPDGLESSYDLIIQGTGLQQSILSCAAARIGKRVLHLDLNDHYGEDCSSFTLRSLFQYHKSLCHDIPADEKSPECDVEQHSYSYLAYEYAHDSLLEVHCGGSIQQISTNSSRFHPVFANCLVQKNIGIQSSPESSAGVGSSSDTNAAAQRSAHPACEGYSFFHDNSLQRLLYEDRRFTIDLKSKLLFASGDVVDFFISSGVARYLEFKNLSGLHFWMNDDSLWRVPSSKVDVFNSKMLTALEKRTLMKFHQFVADWGRDASGSEVMTLNERDMGVGRSLYRPQNKDKGKAEYDLDRFIDSPFLSFLQHCKITPKLQSIIVYALCGHCPAIDGNYLQSKDVSIYTTRTALTDMFRHLNSLSRYGQSAYLMPLYGTGEVVQAFCRMSAVWGTTFILRRKVVDINYAKESPPAELGKEPQQRDVIEAAVASVTDSEGNVIKCGAFVTSCGKSTCTSLKIDQFLCSSISIWSGEPIVECPAMIVIPPDASYRSGSAEVHAVTSLRNVSAVHVTIQDDRTCVVPNGGFVLHITTTLVDGNQIADLNKNWHERAASLKSDAAKLIDDILVLLMGDVGMRGNTELYRSVSLQAVTDRSIFNPKKAQNMWVFPFCEQCCSFDAAYRDAEKIFQQMFPDEDFSLSNCLPPHNSFQGADNDEETEFLKATLDAASLGSTTVS